MHRLLRAATYAATHAGEDIHVADMAREAGLSSRHFIRRFKRVMGITPARYLTVARLEKAQMLLSTTLLPIVHIAAECGFSSQSSLTTSFKEEFNMTPARYRRENSTDPEEIRFCDICPFRGLFQPVFN